MKIIGLTGGIGSGKSTIARFFKEWGIPVYIADDEAKKLMMTPVLRQPIVELLGAEAYEDTTLNRNWIAKRVFKDNTLLDSLNAIVHPAVGEHFKTWCSAQQAIYAIKEVAILFETGGDKSCDATILITAPQEVRIARLRKRDGTSKKSILDRMARQWPEERKRDLADYIINNIDLDKSKKEARKIHVKILGSHAIR